MNISRSLAFPLSFLALTLALFIVGCSDSSTEPADDSGLNEMQRRMNAASPGDTIVLDPGVYTDLFEYTDFIGRTFPVFCVMKPGVVVRGATGNPEDVIIDAGGVGKGFWFHQTGDSTGLAAVTVRHATWAVSGYEASPWIEDCILEDSGDIAEYSASAGVGMYFDRSNSRITNCLFRNNEAHGGAGATFSISSSVHLVGCVFSGNHATGSGGGLSIGNDSRATLLNCQFVGNTAGEYGGGVYCYGDSIRFVGGGIADNTAGQRGGGIHVWGTPLGGLLEHVVISRNSAPEGAEGFVSDYSGPVNVVCCDTDTLEWFGGAVFLQEDCD